MALPNGAVGGAALLSGLLPYSSSSESQGAPCAQEQTATVPQALPSRGAVQAPESTHCKPQQQQAEQAGAGEATEVSDRSGQ